MMTHRWRGVTRDRDKKKHSDLNHVLDINDTHYNRPFTGTRSRNSRDVEIVGEEI